MGNDDKNTVFDGANHMKDSLAILLNNENHEKVGLVKFIENGVSDSGRGSTILAYILYRRMVERSFLGVTSYAKSPLWFQKGVFGKHTKQSIEEWICKNEYANDMRSADLMTIAKPSGWFLAWKALVNCGLVRINRGNRIVLEYPVDGELYSLQYAATKLRTMLKKSTDEETSLDTNSENGVKLQAKEVKKEETPW